MRTARSPLPSSAELPPVCGLIRSRRDGVMDDACAGVLEHSPPHRLVETTGKKAVDERDWAPTGNGPEVRAWPDELVQVVRHDPGSLLVQPEAPLGGGRKLDGIPTLGRRHVGDRGDDDDLLPSPPLDRQHDDARPVLRSLLPAAGRLHARGKRSGRRGPSAAQEVPRSAIMPARRRTVRPQKAARPARGSPGSARPAPRDKGRGDRGA